MFISKPVNGGPLSKFLVMRRFWKGFGGSLILLLSVNVSAQDEAFPKSFPVSRYESLWKKSLFEREVDSQQPLKALPNTQYVLTGRMKVDEETKVMVFDKSGGNDERIVLSDQAEDRLNRLVSVEDAPVLSNVVANVVIKGRAYRISYDPQLLKKAPQVVNMNRPLSRALTQGKNFSKFPEPNEEGVYDEEEDEDGEEVVRRRTRVLRPHQLERVQRREISIPSEKGNKDE